VPKKPGRPGGQADQALGRSRGGFGTKIHGAVSGLGLPVKLHLSGGQVADVTQAERLIAGTASAVVIADRGYDSAAVVAAVEATGAEAVIPTQKNRKVQRAYDRALYRGRGVGENFWAKLKQYRRVATRYDKTDECFLGFVHLASVMVMLR
jgi:transposase